MSTAFWQPSRSSAWPAFWHWGSTVCAPATEPVTRSAVATDRILRMRRLLGEVDAARAGCDATERPPTDACRAGTRNHAIDRIRPSRHDHADAHVERAEHLFARHIACFFENTEEVRHPP